MNEQNNGLNNETNNSEVTPRIVKPIPVESAPESTQAPQESAPQAPQESAPQAPQSAPVTPTPVTSQPEKEVGTVVVGKPMSNIIKPIPVGDVGNFAPQATIGGQEVKPEKKGNNPVAVVILILAIIGFIGYALWTYVLKDKIGPKTLTGTINNGYLVYSKVNKGDNIIFKSSDKLTLVVNIKNLETQESVGTKVTYTIREESGKETLELPYSWLTDNGGINIPVTILGDAAIFNYRNNSGKSELAFIANDGAITKVNDYSGVLKEEEGLYIESSTTNGNTYEVVVTRVINESIIKYGNLVSEVTFPEGEDINDEEMEKKMRYVSSDGVSICLEDSKKIPEATTVSALVTYSVKDNVLDTKNPEVSNKEEFSKFVSENSALLCQ